MLATQLTDKFVPPLPLHVLLRYILMMEQMNLHSMPNYSYWSSSTSSSFSAILLQQMFYMLLIFCVFCKKKNEQRKIPLENITKMYTINGKESLCGILKVCFLVLLSVCLFIWHCCWYFCGIFLFCF